MLIMQNFVSQWSIIVSNILLFLLMLTLRNATCNINQIVCKFNGWLRVQILRSTRARQERTKKVDLKI